MLLFALIDAGKSCIYISLDNLLNSTFLDKNYSMQRNQSSQVLFPTTKNSFIKQNLKIKINKKFQMLKYRLIDFPLREFGFLAMDLQQQIKFKTEIGGRRRRWCQTPKVHHLISRQNVEKYVSQVAARVHHRTVDCFSRIFTTRHCSATFLGKFVEICRCCCCCYCYQPLFTSNIPPV